jgi:hypothetical protein
MKFDSTEMDVRRQIKEIAKKRNITEMQAIAGICSQYIKLLRTEEEQKQCMMQLIMFLDPTAFQEMEPKKEEEETK